MTDPMSTTIRRAGPTDAEALGQCFDAAYAPFAAQLDDLPDMAAGVAEDIARHLVWIAEQPRQDQGKEAPAIAGGLVLIPQDGFMQLANIAVLPAAAGQGLGGRLMAFAEAEARRRGFREMRLSTHTGMPQNVSLYRHLGWQETGRSGAKVQMRKTLSPA